MEGLGVVGLGVEGLGVDVTSKLGAELGADEGAKLGAALGAVLGANDGANEGDELGCSDTGVCASTNEVTKRHANKPKRIDSKVVDLIFVVEEKSPIFMAR